VDLTLRETKKIETFILRKYSHDVPGTSWVCMHYPRPADVDVFCSGPQRSLRADRLCSQRNATQATLTAVAAATTIARNGTTTLAITGGSGAGAVTYAVTAGGTDCTFSGTKLTGKAVGTCTVTATKAGDSNYNADTTEVAITVQSPFQQPENSGSLRSDRPWIGTERAVLIGGLRVTHGAIAEFTCRFQETTDSGSAREGFQ
jgi:hypothetical protein